MAANKMMRAPSPKPADLDDLQEEAVVAQSMYHHIGRPVMLLEFGSKGHIRCVSVIPNGTGACDFLRIETGWHGYYKVTMKVMELAFRWTVPTQVVIPITLNWEGKADGTQGAWRNDLVDLLDVPPYFAARLKSYPLS
jgi:hypothetical protein